MTYLPKALFLIVIFLVSSISSAEGIKKDRPHLDKAPVEMGFRILASNKYLLYCESMCTTTYINRAATCMSFYSGNEMDRCIKDAERKKNQCKRDCR